MTSTATQLQQHSRATCPFLAVFYPCPPDMSIAWTYRTPSVHFSRDFGQVYRRLHAPFAESAKLEQAIKANLRGLGYGG